MTGMSPQSLSLDNIPESAYESQSKNCVHFTSTNCGNFCCFSYFQTAFPAWWRQYFHKLHRSGRVLLSFRLLPELSLPPVKSCGWDFVTPTIFRLGQATLRPLWYMVMPIYRSACLCHCSPLAAIMQKSAWEKRCTWAGRIHTIATCIIY